MQISRNIAQCLGRIMSTLGTVERASLRFTLVDRFAVSAVCFASLTLCVGAKAQTTGSGSIQGVVTDPTGDLVPNAAVTLVEGSTNVTLMSKTNSGGAYAFPNINVGTYTVTILAQVFRLTPQLATSWKLAAVSPSTRK